MTLLSTSLEKYLDQLSSTNVPSGGSALALSGALGSNLIIMYCSISINKANFSSDDTDNSRVKESIRILLEDGLGKARYLEQDFRKFIERDAQVVEEFLSKKKEKRNDEDIKKELTLIPFLTAQRAREALKLVFVLQGRGYPSVEADLMAGYHHARGAVFGSILNVRENLEMISDKHFRSMLLKEADKLDRSSRDLIFKIERIAEVTSHDG